MSSKPDTTSEAAALRQFLAVVVEAVTLNYGADEYDRRLLNRTAHVRALASTALTGPADRLAWCINYLREQLDLEDAEAAERAKNKCARCRRPFDPADKAFDGRARYRETPHCRACVDNCHEGSAEHVCVICEPKRYGGGQ
jgi:hypothetical protein